MYQNLLQSGPYNMGEDKVGQFLDAVFSLVSDVFRRLSNCTTHYKQLILFLPMVTMVFSTDGNSVCFEFV